jgi:hypothetical protein
MTTVTSIDTYEYPLRAAAPGRATAACHCTTILVAAPILDTVALPGPAALTPLGPYNSHVHNTYSDVYDVLCVSSNSSSSVHVSSRHAR